MKNPFRFKSVLTILSVLSVLLGFSVLCLGTLAALQAMDIFSVFPDTPGEISVSYEEPISESFPVHTGEGKTAEKVEQKGVSEQMLMELPFAESYYMRAVVDSELKSGIFAEGIYEIWRKENRFRIHRYHPENGEIEYIAISDGTLVQITDYTKTTVASYPYGVPYSYTELAPVPNFRTLFSEPHTPLSLEDKGETIRFSCYYLTSSVEDKGEFDKETGLLLSYRREHGTDVLLSVTVTAADADYVMADFLFSTD